MSCKLQFSPDYYYKYLFVTIRIIFFLLQLQLQAKGFLRGAWPFNEFICSSTIDDLIFYDELKIYKAWAEKWGYMEIVQTIEFYGLWL